MSRYLFKINVIIYKVTNKENGKYYIGQTIFSLNHRKNGHFQEAKNNMCNSLFNNAIRKHGTNNFKWQIICICSTIKELNKQERYYIKFYDSMNNGYNLREGGLNSLHSESTKNKMSEIRKKWHKENPDINKGKNHSNYGKHHSKETCDKIRNTKKGTKHSDEAKYKISKNSAKYYLGKKRTEKTKKKISKKLIEWHKNHSDIFKGENHHNFGKHVSKSSRIKMKQGNAKYWLKVHTGIIIRASVSDETKEKIRQGNLGKKLSDETKKKMSIAQKRRNKISVELEKQ